MNDDSVFWDSSYSRFRVEQISDADDFQIETGKPAEELHQLYVSREGDWENLMERDRYLKKQDNLFCLLQNLCDDMQTL